MHKYTLFLILLVLLVVPSMALTFDGSVNKNYNSASGAPDILQAPAYGDYTSLELLNGFAEYKIEDMLFVNVPDAQDGSWVCNQTEGTVVAEVSGTWAMSESNTTLTLTVVTPGNFTLGTTTHCHLFIDGMGTIQYWHGGNYNYPFSTDYGGYVGGLRFSTYACPSGDHIWEIAENNTVTWKAINGHTASFEGGVTWAVYDNDLATWYNDTLSGDEYEFTTEIPDGDCVYGYASKSGFTTGRVPITLCDVITGDTTEIAVINPTAGTGDVNLNFYVYWMNGAVETPVYQAFVKVGVYAFHTNALGHLTIQVSNQTNYTYSVSKTGFYDSSGTIEVLDDDVNINVQLYPSGTLPPTPTTAIPTTTVPAGGGEWIISRIVALIGAWSLAAIIIFCFMVTTAYYTQNGMAVMASGAASYILCLGMNIIPIWTIAVLFALLAIIVASRFWQNG